MTQIIMKNQNIESTPLDIVEPCDLQTVRVDNVGDKTIYHYRQMVGNILNSNEQERIEGRNDNAKEFRKVASVPLIKWNEWERMGITADPKALRKALQIHRHELMTTNKNLI